MFIAKSVAALVLLSSMSLPAAANVITFDGAGDANPPARATINEAYEVPLLGLGLAGIGAVIQRRK
jgi:hypothetical protein